MTFIPIDRSRWDREEYFSYFSHEVPCLYSMTLNLDVTPVMKRKERPYPAMLYFLSVVENRHKATASALTKKGSWGTMMWYTQATPFSTRMTTPSPACGQSTVKPMMTSLPPTRPTRPVTEK